MQATYTTLQDRVQSQYPNHLALYLVTAVIILFLSYNVIYKLFFSPLSEYPGPKLWAVTRLPLLITDISGNLESTILSFHKRYGPVIRIAPDELSYTSAEAWKTIYSHRSNEMPKARDGRGIPLPVNGVDGLVTSSREHHPRLRRAVAHAFSEKALREQEPILQSYLSQLLDGIRNHGLEKPIDMANWYNWMTFDIIGDLSFGHSFHGLENARSHPFVSMMLENTRGIPKQHFARYYGIFELFNYIAPKAQSQAREKVAQIAFDRLADRLSTETDRKDFMYYIQRNEGQEEKQLSYQEKQTLAVTLMIAGSETTATLLTGMTFFLLTYPAVYQKLVDEIRDAFVDDGDIDMLKTEKLRYLQACITEALRMYPPVANNLPRKVPEPGETIEGKWVPPGISVGVHQKSTYRDERNFHRANEYIPERWLVEDAPSEFANDDQAALQPFSLGPRNCIGRNLAWAEIRLTMAHILFNFDLELVGDHSQWETQESYLLRHKKPLMVRFHETSV